MFNDIGKIDPVFKPEPLRIHREGESKQGNNRNEQSPSTAEKREKDDDPDEGASDHLLDVRI
jgi:hypothetical protein